VLISSNKDLFLKFLLEPNSILFSQHLHDIQSMPPSPETKHITVLRPYKVVDNERFAGSGKKSDDKLTKKQAHTGLLGGRKTILDILLPFPMRRLFHDIDQGSGITTKNVTR
jgi:hypothetical protein